MTSESREAGEARELPREQADSDHLAVSPPTVPSALTVDALLADLEYRARFWRQPNARSIAVGDCAEDFAIELDRAIAALRSHPSAAPSAETPAEEALRSLASWLGVGGYNAPTVDAKVFEEKIRDGVTIYSQAHGFAARDLAEAVLHMDLITPQGIRAKELARQVLGIVPLAAARPVRVEAQAEQPKRAIVMVEGVDPHTGESAFRPSEQPNPDTVHSAATPAVACLSVPAGYALVPLEPTPEMLRALNSWALCAGYIKEGYRVMLAAAPASPVSKEVGGLTDKQIDALFRRFAGANDNQTPYLRCYRDRFTHIARAIEAELRPNSEGAKD